MSNTITDSEGNSFLVGDYIDKGSFSKVYMLECCSTKTQLAGKFINKDKLLRFGILDNVWNEIKIHQALRHEHIVQFLTYIEQNDDIIIVLEYCSRYSMIHVLHALKTLALNEAKYFMLQIVSAVQFLHKSHIVHRDLKLGNLFISKSLEIKLGDFGLAVVIEFEGQRRFSRCGTPNYLAPEVINGNGHSFEVDIWALGCILYTMIEGTPPFQGENTTSTYNNILSCRYTFSNNIDYSAKHFIMSCLQTDSNRRPNISELARFEILLSTRIEPTPPKFSFGEDERLSLFTKRRRDSRMRVSGHAFALINKPSGNEYHIDCFFRIFKCLRHVKKWAESAFGEFLSEHASTVPVVWVNTWMDYSNSYGFAYKLSNHDFGVLFNDRTRILYRETEKSIHYLHNDNSVSVHKYNSIPNGLRKKVKVLLSCEKYMKEVLVKAHEAKETGKDGNAPVEVFKWVKGENDIVMFMSNGCVQVNFLEDHIKLILCGSTKTATIIESQNYMKTLKLEKLMNCGVSLSLKAKLYIAVKRIYYFLQEKNLC